jgi:putative phage-type endonuclease
MNRKDWLLARRQGIGGSDVHSLFNLEPYGCAANLWMDKKGMPEDFPMLNQNALKRGRLMEPLIVNEYAEETGNVVEPGVELLHHPDLPFLIANTDGTITDQDFDQRGFGVLEAKAPAKDAFYQILKEGLTESYILQMQFYIGVLNVRWGAFAIFWPDGWALETFEVQRDDKLIKVIFDKATEFWDLVQNGEMPERLDLQDPRCKRCVRRKTCWGKKLELMEAEQAAAEGAIDLGGDGKFLLALEDYKQGKQEEKEGKLQKENAASIIQKLMGDEGAAIGGGAKVYYKVQTSKRWDTKALTKDHPELEKKYKTESTSRPFKVY